MVAGVWIRICVAACALFAVLSAPAAASLVWSKPAQLTPAYAANPEVRLDARGLGLLTWGGGFGAGEGQVAAHDDREPPGEAAPALTRR